MKTSQRKENKKRKRLEKDSYCTKKDSSRLRDREVKLARPKAKAKLSTTPIGFQKASIARKTRTDEAERNGNYVSIRPGAAGHALDEAFKDLNRIVRNEYSAKALTGRSGA